MGVTLLVDYPKQTAMVVGYNIRPVACLTKQLGFKVIAIDYWGDLDIQGCVDGLFSVLQQKPGENLKGSLGKPPSDLLVDHAEEAAERLGGVDFILIGSGLDDRPDLWSKLGRIAPILGNSPERLRVVRDTLNLFTHVRDLGVKCPKTVKAKSSEDAAEIARKIGFPVVLKPIRGSGGFRIRLGKDLDEVKALFRVVGREDGEVYVQEYIKGVDASSSVIRNGYECMVVSVNEQLIGKTEFGIASLFGYCGNIVPLKINPVVIERIRKVSNVLGEELGLIGSNGFDFVINSKNEPYLMEVNPRFQATLECIQFVTGINLVGEHIKACRGELLEKVPIANGYAVKVIVFAKEKSTYPELSGIKNIFDISRIGVTVDKGNPICTVQVAAKERDKAIMKAWGKVSEIYGRM